MNTLRFRLMFWAFILILAALIDGCGCEYHLKRVQSKCGATASVKDSVSQKDSVSSRITEKVKLKDTTIYLTVPGPIQYLPNPCAMLCDSLWNLKPFFSESKKNGITSTIFTTGNVLAVDCKTDSLEAVIRGLQEKETERMVFEKHETATTHSETIPVHVRTPFEKFCIGWFWITAILLALFIVYKVRHLIRPTKG